MNVDQIIGTLSLEEKAAHPRGWQRCSDPAEDSLLPGGTSGKRAGKTAGHE